MIATFHKLIKSSTGGTTVMFALSIVPLLLAVGAGVDMVRANRAQAMLQAAVDAAALSAAGVAQSTINAEDLKKGYIKKEVKDVVEDFIAANDVDRAVEKLFAVETKVNKAKGVLNVKIRGKMNTSLLKVVGIKTVDIEAMAEVGFSRGALEVALVLDNTGSMKGTKLTDLKNAATSMIRTLHEQNTSKNHLKIAVVPYSEYVNVSTSPPVGGWIEKKPVPADSKWLGCVGSLPPGVKDDARGKDNKYPAVGGVNCVTELLPLTADRAEAEAKIGSMEARGYTYIPSGLTWGWHVLTHESPYSEALKDKELDELGGTRALVLMTDGENTISANGALHDIYESKAANELTLELCNKIKDDGISLFTVGFQMDSPRAKGILKSCASAPEMAFDATDAAALDVAFSQIGSKLAALYLAK
jgi:Flp pilus assembly protein TadG